MKVKGTKNAALKKVGWLCKTFGLDPHTAVDLKRGKEINITDVGLIEAGLATLVDKEPDAAVWPIEDNDNTLTESDKEND